MEKITDVIIQSKLLKAVIRNNKLLDCYITINEERVSLFTSDIINLAADLNELVNYMNSNEVQWF